MNIKDRTAIVTGAGSGIGRAIALELAGAGARVACVGRRQVRLEETVQQIEVAGGAGFVAPADVTDRQQVESMVASVSEQMGPPAVLFNNAGSFNTIGGLWEVDADSWWHDVTVNLRGPMLCSRAVLPAMMEAGEGLIINMNGGGSTQPMAGGSGVTLACGTGASAVCVAGVLTGRSARAILAHLPGGDLRLEWREADGSVCMTGPATEVFTGEWPG